MPLAFQNSFPIHSKFCDQLYRFHLDPSIRFGKCNFYDPNLVTFCLCIYLMEPFNLVILTWTETFVKTSQSLPTWIFWPNKILKMCDPILVTLLKMQPIIVNPVVKMRPHPAAHPHFLFSRGYPRNVLSFSPDENRNRKKQKQQLIPPDWRLQRIFIVNCRISTKGHLWSPREKENGI